MTVSSSPEALASRTSPVWVESMGGPLIVVPVSALAAWRGSTETGVMAGDATAPDDYDRACAVEDLAGVISVVASGAQALVLADEPATSCFLPEHRAFLRWLAAGSEDELKAAAKAVLVARRPLEGPSHPYQGGRRELDRSGPDAAHRILNGHSRAARKVVQMGNAEHCLVDTFAFQPAVAEDLPRLHPREGMLDAGADLLVRAVVLLLPGK